MKTRYQTLVVLISLSVVVSVAQAQEPIDSDAQIADRIIRPVIDDRSPPGSRKGRVRTVPPLPDLQKLIAEYCIQRNLDPTALFQQHASSDTRIKPIHFLPRLNSRLLVLRLRYNTERGQLVSNRFALEYRSLSRPEWPDF